MLSPVYYTATKWLQEVKLGFPGGLVVKNLPACVGDTGQILGPGRSDAAEQLSL